MKLGKLGSETSLERRRRSTESLSEADARNRLADGVGSAIASTLNWDSDVMDWIAHPANGANSDDPDNLHIIIVLADKKKPWVSLIHRLRLLTSTRP